MKNHAFGVVLRAAILTAAFVTPAVAADSPTIIDANSLDAILGLAKGFGSAELDTDGVGDPMISGRTNGIKYGIYFYGCEEAKDCKDIQFVSGWTGVKLSLEKINEWNRTQRFGKAFIDEEGDPGVRFPVNIRYGVTSENMEDTIDWWAVIVKSFKEFMDENEGK
ncbi:YbjN domain-containing protein [Thiorhodovibrio frisius]|uniref:YbjN domain-containing protein n=1 Tax=Thiorhodovibrio frisius TaxID=631362 RepID=H8YWS2_9GAMM|nr:YbjN domain-containing protein [Thiorhodovibrio frisius]EIC22898.1 hypothetical protein Thi970DRAFT_00537 [Thiorhodovibrio frisius]WPL22842.1 hypothetical protein Thiofri_03017 [Thiorhodovibrio frisius]